MLLSLLLLLLLVVVVVAVVVVVGARAVKVRPPLNRLPHGLMRSRVQTIANNGRNQHCLRTGGVGAPSGKPAGCSNQENQESAMKYPENMVAPQGAPGTLARYQENQETTMKYQEKTVACSRNRACSRAKVFICLIFLISS